MRNFVGSFDCIDKAKICPAAAICTTKTTIYPRIQRLGSRASNKEKKRMKKRNYLTTSHFGGGNSVFTGLASIFHTSTKRRLLSCAKAIIAVFFALFATGCTRYEYINLTDEDEESAPIDTTTRGNQGSSFDFDTCDSEPIDVDLNPQK